VEALDALREFAFGDGTPLTITVDKPLSPHGQRLADSLGVRVEVRPVSASRVIAAHEAMETVLCRQHGCTREADPGLTVCSEHRDRTSKRGTVTETRLRLAAEAKRLRDDERLLQREIAARLGISRSYAQSLLDDPDGSKARARKESYSQPCPRCGGRISGSEGPANVSPLCAACTLERQHEERYWTRETIVETFQRFYAVNGRGPSVTDVLIANPSIRSKMSDERIADGDAAFAAVPLPSPSVVTREFESWHFALAAAGLPRNPSGGAGHRGARKPRGATMARLYHVLHRNGDGGLHEQTVEALSAENAIEQVADGTGEWVAVLDSAWFAAEVEPRNIFAVVKPSA
jgi:hypothetical protein